ncbi:MAG: 8-oxoguanine glycosylase domain protein [Pedosphaera sp.]|nr:8-oxoguanine glycosylase domain protein [Pedosphaera sp.]
MRTSEREVVFRVCDYDLAATLTSGQAFRWYQHGDTWEGVIGSHWVRLRSSQDSIIAETARPVTNWEWLTHYFQIHLGLGDVLASFPQDESMNSAVMACHGLRLLQQDPWECLASFILSSTKQIVQIRQIVSLLCKGYGEPVAVPPGHPPAFAFPSPARLAETTEAELRDCKMGFRAPYLLKTARIIATGQLDLDGLRQMSVERARAELLQLPGVGRKIADCVLLFAYGFQSAFPVDVWIMKALRELYFPRRRLSNLRLQRFTETYFGPNAGYAQQYLFHYMRTQRPLMLSKPKAGRSHSAA